MNTPDLITLMDTLNLNTQVTPEDIPDLDLYMDQLITIFEKYLEPTKRRPEDKLLTKTMINNYTKNKLLMPAHKKRYTKDHVLLMLLIYNLKQVTSMEDIKFLFSFLKNDECVDSQKLQKTYQSYLDAQDDELANFKESVARTEAAVKEKSAHPKTEQTDSLLLCLLLFEQSLNYKRLAEKLLDQLTDKSL